MDAENVSSRDSASSGQQADKSRAVVLAFSTIPMYVLWWNVERILLAAGQGESPIFIQTSTSEADFGRSRSLTSCRDLPPIHVVRYSRLWRDYRRQEVGDRLSEILRTKKKLMYFF